MSEKFTPSEQALIERLRKAPQVELSSEALTAIHSRMIDAFENPPIPTPSPFSIPSSVLIAFLIVGALTTIGLLFALSRPAQVVTPTVPVTQTPAPVTLTPTATQTPTNTPQATPTALPSASITPRHIPTSVPTATTKARMIIEGPIDQITDNVVTIYGIPIQIEPANPLLPGLSIGDIIRVEGDLQTANGVTIIIAVVITMPPDKNPTPGINTNIDTDINTNPSTGEVWQDNGNCDNPPPDWAPANGWRARCQGQDNPRPNNDKPDNDKPDNNNGHGNNDDDDD